MKTLEAEKASGTSLTQNPLYALRYWLSGCGGLIAAAVLTVVGGIVLNWGRLVAAGLALPILALLPCAVMCAVGLCVNKKMGITWFERDQVKDKTDAGQVGTPPSSTAKHEAGSADRHDA